MNVQIIRSRRRTLSLELGLNGLIVRAPFFASSRQIERFIQTHSAWIEAHLAQLENAMDAMASVKKLSEEELRQLSARASETIPARVAVYAPKVGVSYGRITIRTQRTKWGSCSAKGNLNFNCLLMLTPPEVLDSVVVHELCHRKEMNHSSRFYAEVLRVYPEYRKWDKWLKENGAALLMRIPDKT